MSTDQQLNHDHNQARAIHRVIRAMHDGECPRCHSIHDSAYMRGHSSSELGWMCPSCSFWISDEEATKGLALFAKFMEQNLAVFEAWRATL